MAGKYITTGIVKLEDAFVLLDGHFVVCSPFHEIVRTILNQSVAASKKKVALIYFAPKPETSNKKNVRAAVDLSASPSLHNATHKAKSAIEALPKRTRLCLDLTSELPSVFSTPDYQKELLSVILKSACSKELALVVCLWEKALPPDVLSFLKDKTDFFLRIGRTGTTHHAQFLSAKGIASPDFFRPKVVTLSSSSVNFESPLNISDASSDNEVASSGDDSEIVQSEYKRIFLNNPDAAIVFSLWGDYREANTRALELLGYDETGLKTIPLQSIIRPGKLFGVLRNLLLLKKKGKITFRTQLNRKKGTMIDLEVVASGLGKNTYVAICRDITQDVKAESSWQSLQQEYEHFVASLPYPYAIFSNRKLVSRNEAYYKLFPWTKESSPSLSEFFGKKNSELLKELTSLLENSCQPESIRNREISIPASERKTLATELSASVIQFEGKPALYCMFVDVSERRRVLDQAKSSQEQFWSLLNSSPDPVSITRDNVLSVVNSSFVKMFGYDSALALIGKQLTSVMAGRNAPKEILEQISNLDLKAETPLVLDYQGVKNDGTKINVSMTARKIQFDGEEAVLSFHRDVTEQNASQDNFQRQLKGLGILNRIADDIAVADSLDELYRRGMNAAMKMLGFEIGALFSVNRNGDTLDIRLSHGLSENVLSTIGHQQLDGGLARFFDKTQEPVVVSIAEYPPYLHFKALFENELYQSLAFLPLVVKCELHGVLMLASIRERPMDESDRSLLASLGRQFSMGAEKAALAEHSRLMEERFTSTVQNISDVVYSLQLNGTFNYLSPNIETLIGFRPSDFQVNAGLWRTLLHPDDRTTGSLRISHQTQNINELSLEYRMLPKGKASYIWVRDKVKYKRSAAGEVISIEGIITDISDAKLLADSRQLQQEVTESQEILRNVVNAMGDALLISDLDGAIWEVNREFARLTGYDREEIRLTRFPYPWMPEDEMQRFSQTVGDLLAKKQLHDLDMIWRHRDGHDFSVRLNTTLLSNAQREPMAILTVARDVSERERLSVELGWKNKQIEVLNRIIGFANTAHELVSVFDMVSSAIHDLVPFEGFNISLIENKKELSPLYVSRVSVAGDVERVELIEWDEELAHTALRVSKAMIKDRNPDSSSPGSTLSQLSIPLFVNEKALGVLSVTSDRQHAFGTDESNILLPIADEVGAIIQRIRLFQQVSNDSTYIHNLLNSINNVVYTVDPDYKITHVNKAWREFMTGLGMDFWASDERVIGESLESILPDPKMWNHYKQIMGDLFARRINYYSRDFEITHNMERIAYHLVINPMVMNDKVTAIVFTHTDITEINRSEAEIRQRNKELLALNAIATSISKSLELEEILRVATEQLQSTFDAAVVAFYLLNEESRELILSRHVGISSADASRVGAFGLDTSLVGKVITQRKPIYMSHVAENSIQTAESGIESIAALGLQSTGIIPLQSKDSVPGAFMISFSKSHVFTENEQQLLLLIGNQLGAAVENAQLYSEVQQQVKTLTTLYELGKGLTEVLDLNSMLQLVYREIRKSLPLDRFYYQAFLADHNTLALRAKGMHDVIEFYPAGMRMPLPYDWPTDVYLQVGAHGKPYIGKSEIGSMIAVPIKSEEKVIGIISIMSSMPHIYANVHLRLLESIANLTGVAISKATLYDDMLKKSTEIEERNKELDDFTYVVSHDLKEPLISIDGYSKIVLKEYKDKLDSEGKAYLGAVVQSTNRMKNLIDDLLTLSRVGRMHEAHESVSVHEVIDEILHDLQFSLKEKNVSVTVADHMPKIRYSSTRLSMVFRNLLSNAMKFNDKPNPTISIGHLADDVEHVFSITDNGIGIEPQYFDRIFTIFQRLKRNEEYRGTGAGLTIAKKIVEREGGRMWVESVPDKGSTFYFTIRKSSQA